MSEGVFRDGEQLGYMCAAVGHMLLFLELLLAGGRRVKTYALHRIFQFMLSLVRVRMWRCVRCVGPRGTSPPPRGSRARFPLICVKMVICDNDVIFLTNGKFK